MQLFRYVCVTKNHFSMKKNILSLLALAMLSLTACKKEASATTDATDVAVASDSASVYKVDKAASVIEWIGAKPAGKHTGTIAISEGEITATGTVIESGKFTIDMTSITVTDLQEADGKGDLEAHLKGTGDKAGEDHFFNVGKFPTGTFEITNVSNANGKTTIEGNLTLKGITKNVKIPASVVTDPNGITITSETFTINRTEWGVNYASKSISDDLKDKFINDDIELKVTVKAIK